MTTVSGIKEFLFSPIGKTKNPGFFGKLSKGECIGGGIVLASVAGALLGRTKDNTIIKTTSAISALAGVVISLISMANRATSSLVKEAANETSQELNNDDLSITPSGNGQSAEEIKLTAAYQANMTVDTASTDRWVDWRVLVDAMQNHVDETRIQKASLWRAGKESEAKALKPDIVFRLKDGRTISVYDPRYKSVKYKDITSIIFSDNGKGYDKQRVKWVWSSKTDKDLKAYEEMGIDPPGGKFGEGLKMVMASILTRQEKQKDEGIAEEDRIGITYRSRDWQAKLVGIPLEDDKGSTVGVDHEITDGLENVYGSQTIIHNPTQEMVKQIKDISGLCLDFASPSTVIAQCETGSAHKRKGENQVYVRGYRVSPAEDIVGKDHGSIFSYNLRDVDIIRDRDKIDPYQAKSAIGETLLYGASESTIETLLDKGSKGKYTFTASSSSDSSDSDGGKVELEFQSLHTADYLANYMPEERRTLWRDTFYKKFGKNAILASSSNDSNKATERAKANGENVVVLNLGLYNILKECGIKTDLKYEGQMLKKYELGLSLDYEKDRWGPLRIILDSLQNHADVARVEVDAGRGGKVNVEIQVDGKWVPLTNIGSYKNNQITAVRFRDNSEYGYSHGHLAQLGSRKNESTSIQVGEFGEGIKIASAAALRLGFDVSLSSQDWIAKAFSYEHTIEDRPGNVEIHNNLGYQVTSKPKEQGSETLIQLSNSPYSRKNLNEILDILRKLGHYVLRHKELNLAASDPKPLDTHEEGNVVSVDSGDIYVKDFYITSEEKERLLYAYNFHNLKTNRDRDIVSNSELISAVTNITANLSNKDLIKHVIAKAIDEPHGKYHEFQDLTTVPNFKERKKLWAQAFKEVCKELYPDAKTVVLASKSESDNKEASWSGFKVITVNEEISDTLQAAGIPDATDILKCTYPLINEASLTDKERAVLDLARWLDKEEILFPDRAMATDYQVYKTAIGIHDRKPREEVLGYCDIAGRRQIGFKQSVLSNPIQFLETYLEEKAHQFSGAPDGHREHFNKAVDSTMWSIFSGRGEKVISKFKEVFDGFDINNIVVQDYPGNSSRQRLVYKVA